MSKLRAIAIYLSGATISLSLIFLLWVLIANFTSTPFEKYNFIPISLLIIVGLVIFVPKRIYRQLILRLINNKKIFFSVATALVVLSIAARFSFLLVDYNPVSDPVTFFQAAIDLATTGYLTDPGYPATFPYLISYDLILAGIMKLAGSTQTSVVILNTTLELLSAFLLYMLVKSITGNKLTGSTAGLIWMLSPLGIVFSALSLPIVIVNTLLILSIYLVHSLLEHFNTMRNIALYSLVVGLSLGLANAFRPIAVVFIIGLAVYFTVALVSKWNVATLIKYAISLAIITASFVLVGSLHHHLTRTITNLPPTINSSGWSLYVGSNSLSNGTYNEQDASTAGLIYSTSDTLSEAQDKFFDLAIERYSSYSASETVDLIVRKSITLTGDQAHSIYNLNSYPGIWNKTTVKNIIFALCAIFTYTLLVLSIYYLFTLQKSRQKGNLSFTHYLAIVFCGLLMASLLVEVSNRYFTPFFIFLTIFGSIGLQRITSHITRAK